MTAGQFVIIIINNLKLTLNIVSFSITYCAYKIHQKHTHLLHVQYRFKQIRNNISPSHTLTKYSCQTTYIYVHIYNLFLLFQMLHKYSVVIILVTCTCFLIQAQSEVYQIAEKKNTRVYCGSTLSDMLSMVCQGRYNTKFHKKSSYGKCFVWLASGQNSVVVMVT